MLCMTKGEETSSTSAGGNDSEPKLTTPANVVVTTQADVSSSTPLQKQETNLPVPCPDCDLCDGSGRISGGIGAVLDWWPIKACRPCPNFLKRGGNYQRSGQGLDEIAFGRDSQFEKIK